MELYTVNKLTNLHRSIYKLPITANKIRQILYGVKPDGNVVWKGQKFDGYTEETYRNAVDRFEEEKNSGDDSTDEFKRQIAKEDARRKKLQNDALERTLVERKDVIEYLIQHHNIITEHLDTYLLSRISNKYPNLRSEMLNCYNETLTAIRNDVERLAEEFDTDEPVILFIEPEYYI